MEPLIIAAGVAAFAASLSALLHRKLLGPNRRLEALLKEHGEDIDFGRGAYSPGEILTRRTPHGEASRGPLRFTLGDLERYQLIQRDNGLTEERSLGAQAYVALTTGGPRPYRLTNLRRGSAAWRLARDLLRPVDEIYDERIYAIIPEGEDAAAATERAIDDLEVLARALTLPEETLIAGLHLSDAGLDALLQYFPEHPAARRAAEALLARPRPSLRGPSAAWHRRVDATLRARAALCLDDPAALWDAALAPDLPPPLRARALSAWPGPLDAAGAAALLAALPPTSAPVVEAAVPHLRALPGAEALLLDRVPAQATPALLSLIAELGGPNALAAVGALLHTDPKELDDPLRSAGKAALARLQARLPAAAQGGLALTAAEAGGLAPADPP